MIALRDALNIHQILIDKFGGSKGLRDQGALESAISRPYATFDDQDLHPTPVGKAAAVFESILMNHPFVDGNKRTAYVLMKMVLMESGLDLEAFKVVCPRWMKENYITANLSCGVAPRPHVR